MLALTDRLVRIFLLRRKPFVMEITVIAGRLLSERERSKSASHSSDIIIAARMSDSKWQSRKLERGDEPSWFPSGDWHSSSNDTFCPLAAIVDEVLGQVATKTPHSLEDAATE